MVYLITYDLNKPGQEYSDLYETIKRFGDWWHFLDSTWLVDTQLTPAKMRDQMKAVMDDNDSVLVVAFGRPWASRLPEEAGEWITEHVK